MKDYLRSWVIVDLEPGEQFSEVIDLGLQLAAAAQVAAAISPHGLHRVRVGFDHCEYMRQFTAECSELRPARGHRRNFLPHLVSRDWAFYSARWVVRN